jgi:hypothetical protein
LSRILDKCHSSRAAKIRKLLDVGRQAVKMRYQDRSSLVIYKTVHLMWVDIACVPPYVGKNRDPTGTNDHVHDFVNRIGAKE